MSKENMKQTKLFGSNEEPKVLASLDLAKAETIAKQVEEQREYTKQFYG